MKVWVARDKTNDVWFYKEKPHYNMERGKFEGKLILMPIEDEIFLEVTFENSPQEVELKLVNDVQGK